MKAYLVIVAAFSLFSSAPAHAFGKKPIPAPAPAPAPAPTPAPSPAPVPAPSSPEKTCPKAGSVQAVDISEPVSQKFLDVMKQLGVHTVIRYYDQTNETLPGKTLKPAETDLLARNGFDVMVVFQHNNNNIASFTEARGSSDANRSLQLAASNRQPAGSAIYFGVDGGWSSAKDLASIKAYFAKAGPIIRAGGYRIGAYGSGLVCTQLLSSGAVDFCWLANATGWPGYQDFYATKTWTMVQKLPQDCGGKNADFNVINPDLAQLGEWRP